MAFAEEDVIEATVLNALTQGCDRFLLIDHGSPDETVARAVAAGAEHSGDLSADTPFEQGRIGVIQRTVDAISDEAPDAATWWLHLDADEFPRGRDGLTIRDHLARLDRRYRVVGSVFYNHYPTGEPANERGRHPLDLQPMCERELFRYCAAGHYKHPLIRHDPGEPQPVQWRGLHRPKDGPHAPWIEPRQGIITHHFPFREADHTRYRTELVAARRGPSRHGKITERAARLDAVYAGRWEDVKLRRTRLGNRPVRLQHWSDLVDPADQFVARWYEPGEPA